MNISRFFEIFHVDSACCSERGCERGRGLRLGEIKRCSEESNHRERYRAREERLYESFRAVNKVDGLPRAPSAKHPSWGRRVQLTEGGKSGVVGNPHKNCVFGIFEKDIGVIEFWGRQIQNLCSF